jgi:hypothetical protein
MKDHVIVNWEWLMLCYFIVSWEMNIEYDIILNSSSKNNYY